MRGRVCRVVIAAVALAALAACEPDRPAAGALVSTSVTPCPPGVVLAQLTPPDRAQIRLRVLNGSGHDGLGSSVANEFRNRGLQVVGTGTDPGHDGVAILRYGPRAVGAAWAVRPFFLGAYGVTGGVTDHVQLSRSDDVVDIVLGRGFEQLATPTEVNQATARLSPPTAPPGTCTSPE